MQLKIMEKSRDLTEKRKGAGRDKVRVRVVRSNGGAATSGWRCRGTPLVVAAVAGWGLAGLGAEARLVRGRCRSRTRRRASNNRKGTGEPFSSSRKCAGSTWGVRSARWVEWWCWLGGVGDAGRIPATE